MNEQTRAYIYRVSLAVIVLLAGYGVVGENEVALWTGLATAVLNTSLAIKNTSRSKKSFTARAAMAQLMYEAGMRGNQITTALNLWEVEGGVKVIDPKKLREERGREA